MSDKLNRTKREDVSEFNSEIMFTKMRSILMALRKAGAKGLTKKEYAIGTGQFTENTYSPAVDCDRFNRNCRMMNQAGYLPNRERDGQEYRYYISNVDDTFDIDATVNALPDKLRLLSRKFTWNNAYYESPDARTGALLKDL